MPGDRRRSAGFSVLAWRQYGRGPRGRQDGSPSRWKPRVSTSSAVGGVSVEKLSPPVDNRCVHLIGAGRNLQAGGERWGKKFFRPKLSTLVMPSQAHNSGFWAW